MERVRVCLRAGMGRGCVGRLVWGVVGWVEREKERGKEREEEGKRREEKARL